MLIVLMILDFLIPACLDSEKVTQPSCHTKLNKLYSEAAGEIPTEKNIKIW